MKSALHKGDVSEFDMMHNKAKRVCFMALVTVPTISILNVYLARSYSHALLFTHTHTHTQCDVGEDNDSIQPNTLTKYTHTHTHPP